MENAYADLKSSKKTGNAVPYDCLPVYIEEETVYAIDYIAKDSTITRRYYLTDGTVINNEPSAEEISI